MSGRTLILGGGFGGIAAGVELRRLLGPGHEVVLVDRNPAFVLGLRKLWDLVGRGTVADGSRERRLLERRGIEFVQAEISSIDAAARSAAKSEGALSGVGDPVHLSQYGPQARVTVTESGARAAEERLGQELRALNLRISRQKSAETPEQVRRVSGLIAAGRNHLTATARHPTRLPPTLRVRG